MKRKLDFCDKEGNPLTEEQQNILSRAFEETDEFKELTQKIEKAFLDHLYGTSEPK